MVYITMTTMALGLFISVLAGTVHYFGAGSLFGPIHCLPHAELLLGNPGAVLVAGAVLMILSVICRPARVE